MRPQPQPDMPPTSGTMPSEDGGDAVPVAFRPEPSGTTLAPESELPVVDKPEPDASRQVHVSLAGPWDVHAFQASRTLTIDRSGVLVDESDVAALISSAALAGVTLKVG